MRRRRTAHRFGDRRRTTDVLTEETLDFSGLMLSSAVLEGLTSAGFERPSPIQLKAIPLGRCGLDLIAQAKSGTGKTCVFSVIALENINLAVASVQVLILAPTREIAVQIKDVVCSIGRHMEGLHVHVFIGGMPVGEDKRRLTRCHVAVGTPGRVKSLIENKFLKTESIRLFILDEADKLLDDSFQSQINWIFSTLPTSKQMLALSATYTDHLAQHLKNYMKDPTFVRLNAFHPALEGIRHYRSVVPSHSLPHQVFQEKVKALLILLSKLSFHQCLIFSNYQIRARNLSETLSKNGWPSTYISGSQEQNERLKAMEKLKEFKCRILISTDLTSRGIDAERVNLVINMDVPRDSQTYLHRVGRAGRFGSYGAAVNFVAEGKEVASLDEVATGCGIIIDPLPEDISQLLSEPVTCNGKQPVNDITRSIRSPESEVAQFRKTTDELAEEKCVNNEEMVAPVDGETAEHSGAFGVINGDTIEMEGNASRDVTEKKSQLCEITGNLAEGNRVNKDEVVGPVDGGTTEHSGAFGVINGTIETEGNAGVDVSEKKSQICKITGNLAEEKCVNKEEMVGPVDGGTAECSEGFEALNQGNIETEGNAGVDVCEENEEAETQAFRNDLEEQVSTVVLEEKKEEFTNRVSVVQQVHEVYEEKEPGINKSIDKATDYKGILDMKLRYIQPGDIREDQIFCLELVAGKDDQKKESSCSAVADEKPRNKEFRGDLGCYLGNFGDIKGQSGCLLEKSRNGEHANECISSNVKALDGHRVDKGRRRGHCGTEEHLEECRDTEELLVEHLETEEHFGEHSGTEEDHGERLHTKEYREEQVDKPKPVVDHCDTGEHLRDSRDNKEHLEGLCDYNKHLKMECVGFSEDISGRENTFEDIQDVEELRRREFVIPLENVSKAEFSPTQKDIARRFHEESGDGRPFKSQLYDESIVEKQLDREKGESAEESLDCGVDQDNTKLENGVAFYGECFDNSAVKKNSVIFRRTGESYLGIESVCVPPRSGGSESTCSEESGSNNSCSVVPRSESSCAKETGSERSRSEETGSKRSCSEETGSEGSCSEETGSESSGIESLEEISGEDFNIVLESYLQTRASGEPSNVRTRSEEVSKSVVATESRALIGQSSQSKVMEQFDGQAELVVINKPQDRQSCTESDQDENDVIKTRHHLSRDAESAAWASGCDLAGSQGIGQDSEGATFHGASAENVSGYLSSLPDDWKRVWREAYERQTKLISTYVKVYNDAFY